MPPLTMSWSCILPCRHVHAPSDHVLVTHLAFADMFTHPLTMEVLRQAGVEAELRELLLEAQATYKKKVRSLVSALCKESTLPPAARGCSTAASRVEQTARCKVGALHMGLMRHSRADCPLQGGGTPHGPHERQVSGSCKVCEVWSTVQEF